MLSGIENGIFSQLVPDTLRRSYQDKLGRRDEIGFLVAASATISMNQSVLLDRCLRNTARSLKESVGILQVSSITRS